ncbi:MAG: AAC(3) family N-acetyltransferase, partial [Pseudomonadota bacterium]
GWNRCSALHASESLARHRRTKTRRFKRAPSADAGPEGAWVEAPDVADDLDTLFPLVGAAWEAEGGVRHGRVGGADAMLTGYAALLDFASRWLDERNRADGVPPV